MPGGVHDLELHIANLEALSLGKLAIRRRRFFEWNVVDLRLTSGSFVESSIERMQIHRHVPTLLDRCDRADVIDVSVRYPDRIERRARVVDRLYQAVPFAARIDYHRAIRAIVYQQIAVFLERSDGESLDYHPVSPAESGSTNRSRAHSCGAPCP